MMNIYIDNIKHTVFVNMWLDLKYQGLHNRRVTFTKSELEKEAITIYEQYN